MNDMGDGSPPKALSAGPKSRICYICGRPYGTNSYEIHLKQCKELWIAREEKKDPKERKKLPEDPFANGGNGFSSPSKSGGGKNSNSSNNGGDGNDGGGGGGGGGGGAMTLEEMNKIAGAAFNTEALDTCKWCSRTFLPEKLVIHNRSCTQDTPARSLAAGVRKGTAPVQLSVEYATPTKRPSSQAKFKRPSRGAENTEDDGDDNDYQTDNNTHANSSSGGGGGGGSRSSNGNGNGSGHRGGNNSQDASDGGVNLRVSNGSLVGSGGGPPLAGHLGGSSGRELRNKSGNGGSKTSLSSNGGGGNVFGMPQDMNNKEEVFTYLTNRMSNLEVSADSILNEIADIKSFMNRFEVSYCAPGESGGIAANDDEN